MYIEFTYIKYTINLFYFFAILLARLLHTAPMRLSLKRGFTWDCVGIIVAYRRGEKKKKGPFPAHDTEKLEEETKRRRCVSAVSERDTAERLYRSDFSRRGG